MASDDIEKLSKTVATLKGFARTLRTEKEALDADLTVALGILSDVLDSLPAEAQANVKALKDKHENRHRLASTNHVMSAFLDS